MLRPPSIVQMIVPMNFVFFLCLSLVAESKGQTPETITNSIGIELVLISKGTFTMGSPIEEEGAENDEEQHEVTINQDYYLGVTEVTQGEYEMVMGTNPSHFQKRVIRKTDSTMYPVEQVSWEDAVEFCKVLSDLPEEKQAGRVYRLPTEAEWENACRAGHKTAYGFGESSKSLGDYAWFANNSGSKELDADILWSRLRSNPQEYVDTLFAAGCTTHPVGEKNPNAWGLYDMHGNVWEWCSDFYGEYSKVAVSDPSGPKEGTARVIRGGGWDSGAARCRSAYRNGGPQVDRSSLLGFRVALSRIARNSPSAIRK